LKKKDEKKDKKKDKKHDKKDDKKKDKKCDKKSNKVEKKDHHKGKKHHGPPRHCMFKACFGFLFSIWGLFNLLGFYYHFGAIKCINNSIVQLRKS